MPYNDHRSARLATSDAAAAGQFSAANSDRGMLLLCSRVK